MIRRRLIGVVGSRVGASICKRVCLIVFFSPLLCPGNKRMNDQSHARECSAQTDPNERLDNPLRSHRFRRSDFESTHRQRNVLKSRRIRRTNGKNKRRTYLPPASSQLPSPSQGRHSRTLIPDSSTQSGPITQQSCTSRSGPAVRGCLQASAVVGGSGTERIGVGDCGGAAFGGGPAYAAWLLWGGRTGIEGGGRQSDRRGVDVYMNYRWAFDNLVVDFCG